MKGKHAFRLALESRFTGAQGALDRAPAAASRSKIRRPTFSPASIKVVPLASQVRTRPSVCCTCNWAVTLLDSMGSRRPRARRVRWARRPAAGKNFEKGRPTSSDEGKPKIDMVAPVAHSTRSAGETRTMASVA
jgi:hypothetical protein